MVFYFMYLNNKIQGVRMYYGASLAVGSPLTLTHKKLAKTFVMISRLVEMELVRQHC